MTAKPFRNHDYQKPQGIAFLAFRPNVRYANSYISPPREGACYQAFASDEAELVNHNHNMPLHDYTYGRGKPLPPDVLKQIEFEDRQAERERKFDAKLQSKNRIRTRNRNAR